MKSANWWRRFLLTVGAVILSVAGMASCCNWLFPPSEDEPIAPLYRMERQEP